MSPFTELQARFPDQFAAQESLGRHTVARLGGEAEALLTARSAQELIWAAEWAKSHGVAWLLLGGGANVLASDKGFHGLVIVNQARHADVDPDTGAVEAESGISLTRLSRVCISQGLKGFEWAVNVPGTIGGAVVNNAGAHGGDMAGNLVAADIFDMQAGESRRWEAAEFAYTYRHSCLKGVRERYIVLKALLQFEPGHDPADLQKIAEGFIEHRKRTQPPGASLGSMFKNPPGDYAGRLIEAAGLKGTHIGGVQISPIHANFFINTGGGTAADYDALIRLAQEAVKAQFGIELELEIERVGDW